MSRLARRLADTVTPASLLPAVAETIGVALRLPYVAVELEGGGGPVAVYGSSRGAAHRITLTHQGVPVGALVIGSRSRNEQFSPADLRVLDDVARQVAIAAHAVRLTEDLRRSRERLVLAREEERRRLRRDLHDGLGSTLAGLGLYAGNARRSLATADPRAATEWISRLEDGIRAAVGDVRRLVDDLRPPALDELGLVAALRHQAAVLPLPVSVDSPEPLPPLPAAVEVAAYRIAVEAMVNAARHAHAGRVEVNLSLDGRGALCVRVADDGGGIVDPPGAGLGLTTMRERAAELGGSCEIGPAGSGGTVVRAVLPPALHVRES